MFLIFQKIILILLIFNSYFTLFWKDIASTQKMALAINSYSISVFTAFTIFYLYVYISSRSKKYKKLKA